MKLAWACAIVFSLATVLRELNLTPQSSSAQHIGEKKTVREVPAENPVL
jgi:hypothetical protein